MRAAAGASGRELELESVAAAVSASDTRILHGDSAVRGSLRVRIFDHNTIPDFQICEDDRA